MNSSTIPQILDQSRNYLSPRHRSNNIKQNDDLNNPAVMSNLAQQQHISATNDSMMPQIKSPRQARAIHVATNNNVNKRTTASTKRARS